MSGTRGALHASDWLDEKAPVHEDRRHEAKPLQCASSPAQAPNECRHVGYVYCACCRRWSAPSGGTSWARMCLVQMPARIVWHVLWHRHARPLV